MARAGRSRSRRTRLDDVPFRLDPASNSLQDLVNRLLRGVGMKLLLDGAVSLENDLLEILVLDEFVLVSSRYFCKSEVNTTMKGSELTK